MFFLFFDSAGPNIGGPNSCPDRGCDAGTLAEGWGSGTGNYPYLIDPLTALQVYIRKENPRAVVEGILDDFNSAYQQSIARQADICLAFVNANSGEGYVSWISSFITRFLLNIFCPIFRSLSKAMLVIVTILLFGTLEMI